MRDFKSRRSTWGRDEQAAAARPGPGKRTLTEMSPAARGGAPVQQNVEAAPARPRPTIHELFGGVQCNAAGAEPDAAAIQASAGHKDPKKKPSADDGPEHKHEAQPGADNKTQKAEKSEKAEQPVEATEAETAKAEATEAEAAEARVAEAEAAEAEAAEASAIEADHAAAQAEINDTMARIAEARTALAQAASEIHVCHAGCVHGQFDRMIQGYSTPASPHIEPGAMEDAIARWKAKKKSAVQPRGGEPASDPQSAPPSGLDSPSPDAQTGEVGTVSPGKPGTFPSLMGLATWNFAGSKMPDLQIDTTQDPTDKSWTATIKTTSSSDATASAIATPAGTYALAGVELVNVTDDDTGKTTKVAMKKQIVVAAAAAAQIKAAEQEHLDDITQAYTITTKAAETAVNAQAAQTFNDPKKADAIAAAKKAVGDALDAKLTASPAKWVAMLTKTSNLTKSGRDASGWHTFNYTANGSDIDLDAKMVTYRVQNNPNVGTTASATLIVL